MVSFNIFFVIIVFNNSGYIPENLTTVPCEARGATPVQQCMRVKLDNTGKSPYTDVFSNKVLCKL